MKGNFYSYFAREHWVKSIHASLALTSELISNLADCVGESARFNVDRHDAADDYQASTGTVPIGG